MSEPVPHLPPARRRLPIFWIASALVVVFCLGTLKHFADNKIHRRSVAYQALNGLPVPASWQANTLDDVYKGPRFGLAIYATITRHYDSLPDSPAVVTDAATRAAAQAGWAVDTEDPSDVYGELCSPRYSGCWSKGRYRLFFTVDSFDPPPTEPQYLEFDRCPNPPNHKCTRFSFEIAFKP